MEDPTNNQKEPSLNLHTTLLYQVRILNNTQYRIYFNLPTPLPTMDMICSSFIYTHPLWSFSARRTHVNTTGSGDTEFCAGEFKTTSGPSTNNSKQLLIQLLLSIKTPKELDQGSGLNFRDSLQMSSLMFSSVKEAGCSKSKPKGLRQIGSSLILWSDDKKGWHRASSTATISRKESQVNK